MCVYVCLCVLNNVQIPVVHHEETEDSVDLQGQLKEWSNYIIKGAIIRQIETCSLYWMLRSYLTFVYWYTDKRKSTEKGDEKTWHGNHSEKMSVSYFTEKKKTFYWVSWQRCCYYSCLTLLTWHSSIKKCSYLRIFLKRATRRQLPNLSFLGHIVNLWGCLLVFYSQTHLGSHLTRSSTLSVFMTFGELIR